jgi:hypothetical protein
MRATSIVPAWVEVPPGQLADAHRIAHALAPAAAELRPVAATLDWVTSGGARPAPMTGRPLEPTASAVRSEMMLADSVALGGGQDLDAAWWSTLGVAPARSVTTDVVWSRGTVTTTGWLLGLHTRPPVRLPRRLADGTTPSADDLYAEYSARAREPEQRRDARAAADRDAALYRRLAELAATTA